jgi:hypothetical protein
MHILTMCESDLNYANGNKESNKSYYENVNTIKACVFPQQKFKHKKRKMRERKFHFLV